MLCLVFGVWCLVFGFEEQCEVGHLGVPYFMVNREPFYDLGQKQGRILAVLYQNEVV